MTELQKKVLELLKDIDQLCQEVGVEYYLTASTLLGAMRHKGFIPWDDDADVIMTRNNWEKFLEETKGKLPENIYINTQYENANLAMTANHFTDISTAAIYRYDLTTQEKTGIMVDILIMDPVPDNYKATETYITALAKHTELTTLTYQYSLRIGKSTHFSWYWFLSHIIGKRATLDLIDKTAFSYSEGESRFYVQRFAGSPHFWPKEYFGKPKYVSFEDTMLPVPERAADCLCIGFDDDWMYVPDGGQLKSTHEYCVRSLSVPASIIEDDFHEMVNQKSLLHTYVSKKKILVRNTQKRLYEILGKDRFVEASLQLTYARKREEENFLNYVNQKNYDALAVYFKEYMDIQCTSRYLGSSSLSGWLNWYRKCQPFLIDIGDDELYAVLTLLFHQQHLSLIGKLLKARKAIERPFTDNIRSMETEYEAVKTAISHFSCEEWTECQQVINEFLPRYSEDPFLIELNIELKLKTGCKLDEVRDEIEKGLELFPNDAILLLLKAENLFEIGENEKAVSIYQELSGNTRHGLILFHMKEKVEELSREDPENQLMRELLLKIKIQIGEEERDSNNLQGEEYERGTESITEEGASQNTAVMEDLGAEENFENQVTLPEKGSEQFASGGVLKVRLKLLIELAEICSKNNIKYFLIGKALLQAMRTGKCTDPNTEFTVAMFPEDCIKFMEAVEEEGRTDRYIDSMYTNPDFHRFALFYCDQNSLDMRIPRCGLGNKFGLHIAIEILRNPANNKYVDMFYRGLESGWENSVCGKCESNKQLFSKAVVQASRVLLGHKRAAKLIFKKLLKGPKNKNTKRIFLKPYESKRKYYPGYYFSGSKEIQYEDHSFMTMKSSDTYLKKKYGRDWIKNPIEPIHYNPINHIASSNISYKDYLDYLKEHHIDRTSYWGNYNKVEAAYTKVRKANEKIDHYWDIMSMCGDRYRLYEKYEALKPQITTLYKAAKVDALYEIMEDYIETSIYYKNRGLNVCCDMELSDISEYVLSQMGKTKETKELHNIRQKQPMQPLNANFIRR